MNTTRRILFYSLLSFFIVNSVMAQKGGIGKVIKIRGKAYEKRMGKNFKDELKLNSPLYEGSIVNTMNSSFLKIEMNDKTRITLGQKSKIEIQKFQINKARNTFYHILAGKIRANIRKSIDKGDKVKFKAHYASIGVRGTSFLTNVYKVNGKPSADVLLMEGSVDADISKANLSTKSTTLKKGQLMNSTLIKGDGNLNSVKTLSDNQIKTLLANEDSFLPNYLDKDGNIRNIDKIFKDRFMKQTKNQTNRTLNINIKKENKSKSNSGSDKNKNETNVNIDL